VTDGLVPLSVAVSRLREEVWAAVSAAAGEELVFTLGPIELEFQVALTDEGGGEAGVRFWVVSFGAKASRSRGETQTVRFTLTPHLAGAPDADVKVSARGQLGL
jgi:Trypsin-co-occurring domain 2